MHADITSTVGNTPLVRLSRLDAGLPGLIAAKLESFNPCGSVKDRVGVHMLRRAADAGLIEPGGTVVEPSSGNMGIALAMAAAVGGYRLVLAMPENMSRERRQILRALGAEIVLTPAAKGMRGAIEEVARLLRENPDWFHPNQFVNPDNPEIHARSTADEIWRDSGGEIDILVAGVGTGGTITGLGRALGALRPGLRVVAVEPTGSPVLSGGEPGRHGIQGIGAGFTPGNFDPAVVDEIIRVDDKEAVALSRRLAECEGILAGISSGAALAAALSVAGREENRERLIVVVLPDTGERYLSTSLLGEEA